MKNKILILPILFFIVNYSFAQTSRINNFEELMTSLNQGENVRVVIHYALCKWHPDHTKNTPTPDAITGMNIDTYEYFAQGVVHNENPFVVFSSSKLIKNPNGNGFVYNYGKLRINSDDTVQVTAIYINPKNFKVLMEEVFVGKLNAGNNNEGINLFK